ncbi:ATP-dependent helicase HrpB [Aurantibacillus circumpalustris]|uniref:ATP-dependent helicase HrpB n=1 Tax=Aurantibacillus circumpalustris TaxID=3036359 RepID=UPI00295AC1E0|nr:ATP-dependent helicase HrpB [Aurantibacillus circumpalustris]
MSFDPYKIDLPVTDIISQVRDQLSQQNTLIVNAPPGAGKSTLLPLALLEEIWLQGKKIIMLEPRRLAARTIAARMASLLGEELGQTIGYRIRFDNKVGPKTVIEVVTEGILTRMLHQDNALENVALVIFDEFHERSLHADVAMALCREAQQVLRPDLRIMVMSATLNMPQLTALLKAPVVVSEGKQYPVEIIYTNDADEKLLPELTARTVAKAISEHEGDVLVFLPGEGEIRKTEELLKNQLSGVLIHPLYGQLPQQEQFLAIMPNKFGKRKVVLATSIAETSLTIEGIKIVVDSGFGRTSKFDSKSGLSRLETIRISKDSADQRAGRAGRLSAGVCYRMWTKATHERLTEHRVPEIMEADLASLVLDMAQWGVSDINQLAWLTVPPKSALKQATDTLEQLDAIENNKITAHGKQIHRLACHPRIAHMLLLAEDLSDKQLATDIAAVLEERDPLPRESGTDINLRIEALRRSRSNNSSGHKFGRIEKVAASYRKMLDISLSNGPVAVFETGLLLAYAYPERIAFARPGNNAQFQLANGKYAMIGHKDDLAHEPWLAVAHMDLREGLGKIFLAAPLNPKDLKSLVKEQDVITWDTRKGGLIATKELKIGSIVLQSKPLPSPSAEHLMEAISNAIKIEGENLLSFDEKMIQLQNRISSLAKWNEEENWPNVTTEELLNTNELWLGPYLKDIKKPEGLKKLDLSEALYHSLDWEKQQALNVLAPSKIEVPSGSKINIQYFPNGATPVLSVRLQEVFGLSDTPVLNNGKTKIVLHLLSPGYKPVQVTADLKSFWNNLYFEVKKELQRRYPKHSWPDDPWTAAAVAKGRSQKK